MANGKKYLRNKFLILEIFTTFAPLYVTAGEKKEWLANVAFGY
jgi:hypothetical protein